MSSFVLQHQNQQARKGVFCPSKNTAPIQTPAYICNTHKGQIPFLTQDETNQLDISCLHLCVGDLYDSPSPTTLKKFCDQKGSNSVHSFFQLGKQNLMLSLNDSEGYYGVDGIAGDKHVYIQTRSGKRQLSLQKFLDLVKIWSPDIVVAFSDSLPFLAGNNRTRKSVERTSKWLNDCVAQLADPKSSYNPALIASVEGGADLNSRTEALKTALQHVDSILGFSFADIHLPTPEERDSIYDALLPTIPSTHLRFASNIGSPLEVLQGVRKGIDIFETNYPILATEMEQILTFAWAPLAPDPTASPKAKRLCTGPAPHLALDAQAESLRDLAYAKDKRALVPGCECACCQKHSRAYLHHLLKVHELTAKSYLAIHNLHHYNAFFAAVRAAIAADQFDAFATRFTQLWFEEQ